jgi:hypothetical protein
MASLSEGSSCSLFFTAQIISSTVIFFSMET